MKNSRYDISLIRKYLNGELDATAMYKLERQAQNNPLLMDLMLGMEGGDESEHREALGDIDALISERINPRSRKNTAWGSLGIAASVLIALSIAVVLLLPEKPSQQTAQQSSKTLLRPEKEILKPADAKAPGSPTIETPVLQAKKAEKQIRPSDGENESQKYQENTMAALHQASDSIDNVLNEVVIVGYGTHKKADLTSAVSSISSDTIQNTLAGRVAGRVAGVSPKALKMEGTEIRIRGTNSVNLSEEIKSLVSGQVTDKLDKKALPGVLVRVKGTNITTTTDANGKFTIGLPDKENELELIYIGYEKESLKVTKKNHLDIALSPNMNALNEVVVVGYGTNSAEPAESKPAQPATGWTAFRKYLKENAIAGKKENEGVVVLSFTISPKGKISDVKIVNGINDETDQKAINLILNGPEWRGDGDGLSKEIMLRIRFR